MSNSKIANSILLKQLKNIIISGYIENHTTYCKFFPMLWWVYLEFKDEYILLTSKDGSITLSYKNHIECNFNIEENDVFTTQVIPNLDYGKIKSIDLFYDNHNNLTALGLSTNLNGYVFFDALNVNGFIITTNISRDYFLNNHPYQKIDTI